MKRKKIFTLLMALLLILSLVMAATVTASAATVKINKTKATVYVGSSITLKISNTSNKVSWSSSNKSVATVKSTGNKTAKVTAKAPGKATITAKVNGKKYKCVVTSKLDKVGSISNPASYKDVIELEMTYGNVRYSVNNILVGEDAENYFKIKSPRWWNYNITCNSKDLEGHKLVLVQYDVEVLDGYISNYLQGNDIISIFTIGDLDGKQTIARVKQWMFDSVIDGHTYHSEIELYGGERAKMYTCLLLPEDITTFTNRNDGKHMAFYVKYDLPQ